MNTYRSLSVGQPAPWFRQRNTSNPSYAFDTVGGRFIVLCFFGTAGDAAGRAALDVATMHRALFDDTRIAFFGVSVDPEDERQQRVRESLPGIRHFWDFDGTAGRLYGALPETAVGGAAEGPQTLRRQWVVLDPGLNVLAVLPFKPDGSDRQALMQLLGGLPPVESYAGMEMHAPVILLPNVFEPALCRQLIALYDTHGGEVSGVMQEVDGKTVGVHNPRHKRRDDYVIDAPEVRRLLQQRVQQKVKPLIRKAFCFDATRMERYIVGCYDSESGGHFLAHRDNTTRGTAHRRFALSLNLNHDFEGGDLSFPEYGPRSYHIPAGAAIVFSGSLLHAVSPVRKGRRYAFLPFLYDDAAAALRESNNPHLAESVGEYRAAPAR